MKFYSIYLINKFLILYKNTHKFVILLGYVCEFGLGGKVMVEKGFWGFTLFTNFAYSEGKSTCGVLTNSTKSFKTPILWFPQIRRFY